MHMYEMSETPSENIFLNACLNKMKYRHQLLLQYHKPFYVQCSLEPILIHLQKYQHHSLRDLPYWQNELYIQRTHANSGLVTNL